MRLLCVETVPKWSKVSFSREYVESAYPWNFSLANSASFRVANVMNATGPCGCWICPGWTVLADRVGCFIIAPS